MFRECDSSKQSPINIDTSELQTMRTGPLRWSSGYFSVPRRMTLENTGHECKLLLKNLPLEGDIIMTFQWFYGHVFLQGVCLD